MLPPNIRVATHFILDGSVSWAGHELGVREQCGEAKLPKLLSILSSQKKRKVKGAKYKVAIISQAGGEE